jgi:hypothetical protein
MNKPVIRISALSTSPLANEKGLAMVLAITLVGLLSSLGVYLILQSSAALRMTKAMGRHEVAVNMAEAGLQLGLRCIRSSPPSPSYEQLTTSNSTTIKPITEGIPTYIGKQNFGAGSIDPRIDYIGYRTTPPAGWMLNWQGYSSFHGVYYRSVGEARIPLPAIQGDTNSILSTLALRVSR